MLLNSLKTFTGYSHTMLWNAYTYFIITMVFIHKVSSANNYLSLSLHPPSPIPLGGKVILTCKLNQSPRLSIIWKRNTSDVGENCDVFRMGKLPYRVDCGDNMGLRPTEYNFTITQVRWEDRGPWSCVYGITRGTVELEVTVPPKMLPLSIVRPTAPLPKTGSAAQTGSKGGTQTNNLMVLGKGTKSDPLNLMGGQSVELTCSTSCASPRPQLTWDFRNTTKSGMFPPSTSLSSPCLGPATGMETTKVSLHVNCTRLGLHGLLRMRCFPSVHAPPPEVPFLVGMEALSADQGDGTTFVLCPSPQRLDTFTQGEIVAMAAGCTMGLIVFLTLLILHRQQGKAFGNNPEEEIML